MTELSDEDLPLPRGRWARGRSGALIAVALALAAAVGVGAYFTASGGGSAAPARRGLTLPAALPGFRKVPSDSVQAQLRGLRNRPGYLGKLYRHVIGALYTNHTHSARLIVFATPTNDATRALGSTRPASILGALAGIDPAAMRRQGADRQDQLVACGSATYPSSQEMLPCGWTDGRTSGAITFFSVGNASESRSQLAALANAARSAVDKTAPTSPVPSASATSRSAPLLPLGKPATITVSGGTFRLTVVRPVAVASWDGSAQPDDRWLGVVVRIDSVTGSPSVDTSLLGLAPTLPGEGSADDGSDLDDTPATVDEAACQGTPNLATAFTGQATSGAESDGVYDLYRGMPPLTGCVSFYFSAGDHPDEVGFFRDFAGGDPVAPAYAAWRIALPAEKAHVSVPHVTLRVTGNGSSAKITYGFESVSEPVGTARIPWTMGMDPTYTS